VSKDINQVDTYGGRAALKIDLNDNWSVSPTVIWQDMTTPLGIPGYMAGTDLERQNFQSNLVTDVYGQAGLTVNGRIGNFDLTYAGSYFLRNEHEHVDYSDYSIAYDQAFGSGHFWVDSSGTPLATPLMRQDDRDNFRKYSNEIRLASPSTDRLRFQIGAFQEQQVHNIEEDYEIQGFSDTLTVPGFSNTTWLTDEQRTDRDYAGFTEVSYDITPALTATGGVRVYHYDNTLYGFFGFSEAFDNFLGTNTGMGKNGQNCLPGQSYGYFNAAPCVNLDKSATGSGETHKINLSYKIDDLRMVYFTYSTGFRPGGVNRNGTLPPYAADTLENFEVGLKSQWFDRRLTLNTALYDDELQNFQFAFYGLNDLTEIQNAPGANIKGFEASLEFRPVQALTLSGDLTLQDPHLDNNVCPSNPTTGAIVKTCSNSAAVAIDGTQLPFTAKVKGSLTARYSFDLSPQYHAYTQGSAAYRSKETLGLRISDQQALGDLPAFTTFDLSAGVNHENISMELFVKNVTDERGLLNRYSLCNDAVCKQLYDVSVPPLTIGLRLNQKF
jgi:outer membrane receptor protein involved in Fe transport